uniref:Polycystin cation channel PKD1/PKD2 domain-containing protein n=1 Tax=Scylla olivacea TaxID=85551 RepID=A0A0P4VV82_SCYOL
MLMYRQRCKYFQNYWSYAEIAIIIACYLGIAIYVLRELETNTALKQFARTRGNGYIRMQYAATLHEVYGYVVGFIVFVGTLKFIKLLRFNKRMGLLSATLGQCWDDLSGFMMAFLFCFFTFVTMFFMLLNMYLFSFHNFTVAVETCFSMMLGKFQFEEMQQVSRIVPIMFFVFVLCNSWVLINLLLTLIIKAFTQVKYDIVNQPNEFEMVDFVWRRFRSFLGKGSSPPKTTQLSTTKVVTTDDMQSSSSVKEFPNKIDKFLEYVNSTYFEGSLDFSTKDSLKSSMYHKGYVGNSI